MAEAIKVKMPRQLKNLFCTICVFSNPTEPMKLFEKYQNHFIEDFVHKLKCTKENAINLCLNEFEKFLLIKAPGGCGKTFIYNTITHILRGEAKKVLSVAWTGIASTLLIDGRTVHNAFQIPLDLHEDSRSSMPTQSSKAKYLREVDVIIWDEVIVLDLLKL